MRKIWCFITDTHGGHKLGLMNPDVELTDENQDGDRTPYTPEPTAMQEYLWEMYTQDLNSVTELADGDPIIVSHGGDMCHGNKYPDQLVNTQLASQIIIAVANLQPVLSLPNLEALRIVEGTGAHGFGEGSAEALVCQQVKASHPNLDTLVLRHGKPTVQRVTLDYAHHGPGAGIREWTKGNQARYYLKSIVLSELAAGNAPPMVVLRGHVHEFVWETVRIRGKEYHIIIAPPYCGMSEHGQQATRSKYEIHSGLIALDIEDDHVTIHPFWRYKDMRTREEF